MSRSPGLAAALPIVLMLPFGQCHLPRGAPVDAPRRYVCYRAPTTPTIDGRLDEPAWRAAPSTEFFVDIEGANKPMPRHATRARLLWNRTNLYVGAELEEPNLRASLTQRDAIVYHDDDFEVFLDPDGDCRDYVEIEVNALNTIFDLLLVKPYREGGPAVHEWNVKGLQTAVAVDGTLNNSGDVDRGWSVEMAIPWSALAPHAAAPCPPRVGDRWRMNFSRVRWPDGVQGGPDMVFKGIESNWVWSPQGVVDLHLPERWGWVEFSDQPVEQRP